MNRLALIVAVSGLLLVCLSIHGADDKPVDLPVTRAVLFHSGVGYFEHRGSVDGDATLRLMFKERQINDVLKSMVLIDEGGGAVSTVTYPSNEPLNRALASFSVDLSTNPPLNELLNQLRGATVTVMAPESITGKILGVEKRESVSGNPAIKTTDWILRLVTDKGIRSVNLTTIDTLTLADEKLQDEMNKALGLLVQSRDQDTKPVEIRFTGKGKRNVRVGYIVETPVWKTSYRLDLGLKAEDKPLLQGWAIVENTTDNDWKQVDLSLVSGQPISFVQDLYMPLYASRPVVQPELYASLMPQRYERGIDARAADKPLAEQNTEREMAKRQLAFRAAAPAAAPAGSSLSVHGANGFAAAKQTDALVRLSLADGVQSVATAEKLAELFRFTIQSPVDLTRRRSSMLPIVNTAVAAERVSIYNQSVMARSPLNGVYLTNNTGMKLLGGPVTVFDGGAYAGDAQIGHLSQNEKRLLSYAVDLAVTVDPSVTSNTRITAAKIVKGVLQLTQVDEFTHVYKISSKADAKRAIIIEHPFVNGRKLVEPASFEEKTPEVYRFRTELEAGGAGKFTVREQQVNTQLLAMLDYAPETLIQFARSGEIDPKVRDAIAQAVTLKQQQADLQRQLEQRKQELATLQSGQERLRENIRSVGTDSPLGKRYVTKLATEEDLIEKLQSQIDTLTQQAQAKQKELSDYLAKLSVG
jgi:hypothetical protein